MTISHCNYYWVSKSPCVYKQHNNFQLEKNKKAYNSRAPSGRQNTVGRSEKNLIRIERLDNAKNYRSHENHSKMFNKKIYKNNDIGQVLSSKIHHLKFLLFILNSLTIRGLKWPDATKLSLQKELVIGISLNLLEFLSQYRIDNKDSNDVFCQIILLFNIYINMFFWDL